MKIYLASSWRNPLQPSVCEELRNCGFEVYDFRNPKPGDDGFRWTEVDPEWKNWTAQKYIEGLKHPVAQAGFKSDYSAMEWADCGVLLMPCGRSAHLEAGYFNGAKKPLHIYLPPGYVFEPELMYLMANSINTSMGELVASLEKSK